ncbi:MAG TPA: IPT/TIG domain-containing protein [Cyclobacteriaceae bacterium]
MNRFLASFLKVRNASFITILLLFLPAASFAQWSVIEQFDNEVILDGQLISGQNIAVCGSIGVAVSTNGGSSWIKSDQFKHVADGGLLDNLWFSASNFYDVHFLNAQHGFAAGWTLVNGSEIIIETTDGGLTWKVVYQGITNPNDPIGFTQLQFTSPLIAYAGSFQGRIIKTIDGGKNWNVLATNMSDDIKGIHFVDDNNGRVISGSTIYITSNGGQTWISKPIGHVATGLWFLTNQIGFVSTENNKMFKTVDGGSSWSEHLMAMSVQKIQFTDSQTGYAAGTNIYKTTNGGQSWTLQQKSVMGFTGLHFLNANSGIVTTFNGEIYTTGNGGGNTSPTVTITDFTPTQGLPGTAVTINGENLEYVNSVTIGNLLAPFQVDGNKIYATVPQGIADEKTISLSTLNATVSSSQKFLLIKTPSISSFAPIRGVEGSTVTIVGNNFLSATSVLFNAIPASFTITDNNTIIANVPAGNASGKIDVVTTFGKATAYNIFTKFETPIITSITPMANYRESNITLRGNNFDLGNTVKLNGAIVSAWVKSPTEAIVFGLPQGATSGKFSLENQAAIGYSENDFTVLEGSPSTSITAISPGEGAMGQLITITGTNFYSLKSLKLNNNELTFEVISDNELIAEIPVYSETGVIEGYGWNGDIIPTSAPTFTFLPGEATPEIQTITPPNSIIQTRIVLEGKNFYNVGSVYFNGVMAPYAYRQGLTKLITEVPAFAHTGPISLDDTLTDKIFTVVNNYCVPQRIIDTGVFTHFRISWMAVGNVLYKSNDPNDFKVYHNETTSVVEASKGSDLVIHANPNGNSHGYSSLYYSVFVDWNNDLDFLDNQELLYQSTVFSDYQTLSIPENAAVGNYRMRVSTSPYYFTDLNPCEFINGTGVSIDFTLNIVDEPAIKQPQFNAFHPTTTTYGSKVSVEGLHLSTTQMVTVDGIEADFNFNPETDYLEFTVPGQTTSDEVIISTKGGSFRVKNGLTIIPTPVITEFTPLQDTVGGKVNIQLPFASLSSIAHVYFNGKEAAFVVQNSIIVATIPAEATSGKISVANQFGTYESSSVFTVIPDPLVSSFFPTTAHMGENILITGSGFTAITDVLFNGRPSIFTVVSPTQISAQVPYPGSHGKIGVVNKKDTAKSITEFTVLPVEGTATFREIPSFNYDYLDLNGRVGHFDFDKDGYIDLVIGAVLDKIPSTYEPITIYRNSGNGTFQETGIRIKGYNFMFGDFNRDGFDDIITERGDGYDIYYNDANHQFNLPANHIRLLPLDYNRWWDHTIPRLSKVMDYDHDGDLDIMITASSIAWLEQDNGTFTLHYIEIQDQHAEPYLFEDLDRDGDTDLVTQYKVYLNTNGNYTSIYTPYGNLSLEPLSITDFNRDGYPDILGGEFTYYGNNIRLFKNLNGTGFEISAFGTHTINPEVRGWGDFYNTGITGFMTFDPYTDGSNYNPHKSMLKYIDLQQDGLGLEKESISVYSTNDNIPYRVRTAFFDFENDGDIDMFMIHGFNRVWPRLFKNYTKEKSGIGNNAPTPPTLLTFEKLSENEVILRWNKGTDDRTASLSLNYNVRVKDETTGNLIMAPSPWGTPYGNAGMLTNYYLKRLDPSHTYSFQVQSVDQGYRSSDFSVPATFKLQAPVIAAPSALVVTATGTRSVKLQWNDNTTSEEGFIIEYKKQSEASYSILGTVTSNITSLVDTLSECHATYSFRVKAFNATSVSEYSDVSAVTTLELPTPVISGAGSFCEGSNISLTASKGYQEYIWNTGSLMQSIQVKIPGDYKLTVKDSQGCESFSIKTVVQIPIPLASLEYTGEKFVATGGTTYEWYWNDVIQSHTGNTLIPDKFGKYQVKVTENGCSAFSKAIDFLVNGVEPVANSGVSIFPNPTSGLISIQTGGIQAGLHVFNSLGREVHFKTLSVSDKLVTIDLTSEPSGLFVILIQGIECKEMYRIVLAK